MPSNKQPSFAERTRQMQDNATALQELANSILDIAYMMHSEAGRMVAAAKRFSELRADKRQRRARE